VTRLRSLLDTPEPPREQPRSSPASAGDILERIDCLVAEAETARCGCGCGRPVLPDGPSADFATQDCQRTWHGRQSTDPDRVYNGPDATYLLAADIEEQANILRTSLSQPSAVNPTVPDTPRAVEAFTCPDPMGLAYRRHCPRCDTWVIPSVYRDADQDQVVSFAQVDQVRTTGQMVLRHECPHCGENLPEPVYIADVAATDRPGWFWLNLSTGQARVTRVVSTSSLHLSRVRDGPDTAVQRIWESIEQELLLFTRRWNGRQPNTGGT
jgi:hypothetical protein